VHWLKAKARFDRWSEEFLLLKNEMDWTVRYFNHRSQLWKDLAKSAEERSLGGHAAYAFRQEWMWTRFSTAAKTEFTSVLEK
jgi:hypothetical protein